MAKKKPAKKAKPSAATSSDVSPAPIDDAPLHPLLKATHELVHRSQLKEADYNPRGMNDEEERLLGESLERYGLVNYLVWNKQTGNLVGGHQRLRRMDKSAKDKNYKLWVNVIDVDEKTEKNLNVMLNNPAAMGAFDLAKLGEMFQKKEIDAGEATGFTPAQMYMFFGDDPIMEQPEQLLELAAQMREARERYNKIREAAGKRDDAEYYVIVFAKTEERNAFLEQLGLPVNRYVNGAELAARMLPPASATEEAKG